MIARHIFGKSFLRDLSAGPCEPHVAIDFHVLARCRSGYPPPPNELVPRQRLFTCYDTQIAADSPAFHSPTYHITQPFDFTTQHSNNTVHLSHTSVAPSTHKRDWDSFTTDVTASALHHDGNVS
jgi:hypothetical protein